MNLATDVAEAWCGPLASFADADPGTLETHALLRRVDRKFVMTLATAHALLPALRRHYDVVRAGAETLATYDTTYFDTAERTLYHRHRRGQFPRWKIRVRTHVDRGLGFLEVKGRRGGNTSDKIRWPYPAGHVGLTQEARALIDAVCPIGASRLEPALRVQYYRTMLVGRQTAERISFDLGVRFDAGGRSDVLDGVVIGEIKQASVMNGSPAMQVFRQAGLREVSLSKYSVGLARLTPVPAHTFRPALRTLERLLS